jgi:hypothetical protein
MVVPEGIPKSRTAAEEVPEFVTVADAPGARVVVLPTVTVAAEPVAPWIPWIPCTPWMPWMPCGMPKFSIAARDEPEFVTVAKEPAERVVVLPTVTVAAGPGTPTSRTSCCGVSPRRVRVTVPGVKATRSITS